MVTYHYVKFYVSIIIQLEVININVRNFKFPIGFYNIAGRCHSLQSLEIPCLTLVQSSLQHEDQSVSMNGLVFRIRHAA
jgi:hypothetical protein